MFSKKPKIAIVHDFLIKLGGAEKVLEVLHEIYPDAPVFTLLYDKKGTRGLFEKGYNIRSSKLQKYPKFIRNNQKLLLNKFPKAIENLDLSKYDIVISDSNSFAHGVTTPEETFHLTYCYSPTRYLWDWYHEYLDENNIGFGPKGLIVRRMLYKLRLWDRKASKRTNSWIAISKHVSGRVKKYYGADSNVIYPPFPKQETKNIKKKNYYLVLSRLSPYKKIDLAVEAFNKSGKKLKIIGEGFDFSRLSSLANDNIEFLGYIEDENNISKYLSEAKALIFPGEEDFGLTPLQAMTQGTPVIAYGFGGVTETVLEKKTGLFFYENNSKSLENAVDEFEKNEKLFDSETCIERADEFSTERFKKEFSTCVTKEYNKFNSFYNL